MQHYKIKNVVPLLVGRCSKLIASPPTPDWQRTFLTHNIPPVVGMLGMRPEDVRVLETDRPLSELGSPNFKLGTFVRHPQGKNTECFYFRSGSFCAECSVIGVNGRVCTVASLSVLWFTTGYLLRLFVQNRKGREHRFHHYDHLQQCHLCNNPVTQRMTASAVISACGFSDSGLREHIDATVAGSRLMHEALNTAVRHRQISPAEIREIITN